MKCTYNYKGRTDLNEKEIEFYTNLSINIEQELLNENIVKQQGKNTLKIIDAEKLKTKSDELFQKYGTKVISDLEGGTIIVDPTNVAYATYKETIKKTNISKYNPDTEKKLHNSKEVISAINQRLSNAVSSVSKSTKENKVQFKEQVKKLQGELDILSNKSNLLAIREYVNSSVGYAENVIDYLEELKANLENGKTVQIQEETLENIDQNNMLYSLLPKIKNTINNKIFKQELSNEGIEYEEYLKYIEEAINAQDRLAKLRIELGRYHIANKLAPYSNKVLITKRMQADARYRKEIPRAQGETLKDYNTKINNLVNAEIEDNYLEIQKEERRLIFNRLNRSPFDIGFLASWVNSEKDMNSEVIQLASKLLDESDILRDKEVIDYRIEAFKTYQEFNKEATGTTAQEKYKGFYQEGSDGKLYLSGKYNVEWYVQYQKVQKAYYDALEEYGDKDERTIKALEARNKWSKENSIYKNKEVIPKDKWLNGDYKDIMSKPESGKAKMLQFLIDSSIQNDKKLYGHLSLVHGVKDSPEVFIQVPSIGKTTFEKIDKNLINNIKDSIQEIYKPRPDDTQYGQLPADEPSEGFMKVLTDIEGNIKSGVPIHFRGQMNLKDISYDLMSSITMDTFMATNYKHKIGLSAELELLKDIVAEKEFDKTHGIMKKFLTTGLDKNNQQKVNSTLGIQSNEYKVLTSIMENRLYGRETAPQEYAQLANSLMKWTANSMLMFNMPSAIVNAVQGQVYNFIEAVSGGVFNKQNLTNAQKYYFRDIGPSIKDIGQAVQLSQTNQMMDLFNIQGSMKPLANKFIEDTRVKALFKSHSAFAASHMGEHYMHSVLMYAVLDGIKVLNKDGKFIDKNGKEVSEDKAMSLAQAFNTDKNNKLTLNKYAYKTTHGNQTLDINNLKDNKALLEVKQLINKKAHDLHGNYNPTIQNMAQRYVVLKLVFMLRKWVVPGFNTRWRGAAKTFKGIPKKQVDSILTREEKDLMFSEDTQSFEEGYYSTAIRFISNYVRDIKNNLDVLSFYGAKQAFSSLSEKEQQNIRKFAAEMGTILVMLLLSNIFMGLADGLPDDSDERAAMFYAVYTARRIYAETATYLNPIEAYKIASNPAASMSYIRKLGNLAGQLATDSGLILSGESPEVYERTERKGQLKLQKRISDVIPITSQFSTGIEEKTSWIFNLN